jgi:hypothetical protein
MKLKKGGKSGTNGLDYFDICTNDFKRQFGYISKKNIEWKMYLMVSTEKKYFTGSFVYCVKKAEELMGDLF